MFPHVSGIMEFKWNANWADVSDEIICEVEKIIKITLYSYKA